MQDKTRLDDDDDDDDERRTTCMTKMMKREDDDNDVRYIFLSGGIIMTKKILRFSD